MDSTKGRLLVATPMIGAGEFERSVVFMLEHNEEGALGVILNQPSTLALDDPLPDWAALAASPPVIFVGGPVGRGSVIALATQRADLPSGTFEPVLGAVGVLDIGTEVTDVGPGIGAVRIFTGYAGWAPGQLEDEIGEGAWFVVDADASDPLTDDPDRLWPAVLARQPPPLSRWAHYPPDIRVN